MLTHDERTVDSNCFAPDRSTDYEGDKCGNDASTFAYLPSGVRLYLCPDHAGDVDRFDDDGTDEEHPKVGVCAACHKPTPVEHIHTVDGVCPDCDG